MEPTYFGASEKPLFGIYHPPLTQNSRESAVLICYPFFQEYIRSHRAFRYIAELLAKKGCHVFRFDYSCTGDSFGDLHDAKYSQWQSDIVLAADELRDLSGIKNISIIGLRMGALLASTSKLKNIKNLILWDPIINGNDYLNSLKYMHKEMLKDADRFPIPREDKIIEGFTELLGFVIPNAMKEEIQKSDFNGNAEIFSEKIHFICSSENIKASNIQQNLSSKGRDINYQIITYDSGWNELTKIEEALMPYSVIDYFSELLT